MRWDEMSMSQKSEAIGLMVRNGVTDIGTMKQMWDDMDGRKKKKPSYAEWVKGVNPHFMGPDYNLKAAYDELPFETMEAWRKDPNANHLPDTYKLPSHPTFSLDSKDPLTGMKGGAWLGDRFYPSQANRLFNPDLYPHSGAYMELPYVEMVPETVRLPQPKLSFAEGGFTSPSYPPFNKTPQRTDISDNEKRARGKWHVENAKENQQSIITKAFNEARSRGLTTEQAYEYVADVAKQHGWSKEGSIVGERNIQYKAFPNITSSDNNISPKYITSEPISEEEFQRRKALQSIRQSQKTGNPDVIYDSDEKVRRDNPNNPRTPFEPHPITPKEMDVTIKGLKFLQPFDPTGLTGVPDFLNSVASGKGIGINFVGMFPAIGKVKVVENGSRLARFNNSLMDTGEEVLGNLLGRISSKAGNFINTTTSAVQDITTKPATEIVKQLMQNSGTRAANRFATGWNLGATTANFGRAGEDVYDFFTEDPLVQRIKEGFQFADGGSPDDPPYWGQPTRQPQGPIDYLNRYVRSKAFETRAPDVDYLNTARQNVDRFDRVYNDPAPKRIKFSPFYSNHMIQMYPGGMETPYAPYENTMQVPYMAVLAHEYGHNIDPYFESTRDIPESWMDMYERQSSEANEHDSRPQEIYADLQSLRYQLYEKNIYDIIKDGAFNEKHLEKALKQNIPNRLLQTMPKETIIEMMNTIADNSQPTGNVQDAYILPTDVGLGYV